MLNHEYIKHRREELGISQLEAAVMARDAGFHGFGGPTPYVRWSILERGVYKDPRLSTLEALAFVLDCTIDELVVAERSR